MKNYRRFSLLSCLVMLFAALALTGCLAKNEVRLLYDIEGSKVAPSASAPRIVVVQFEDKRATTELGLRKDGSLFQTSGSVASWTTQAMASRTLQRTMSRPQAPNQPHSTQHR